MHEDEQACTGPNILIVDDQLETLNLMKLHLSSRNYRVEIAANGYEALEKLAQNSFELIVTDINMPGMGGNELCKAIRESNRNRHLPIIALSADPLRANSAFTHVLSKPFRLNDIVALMEKILGSPEEAISQQG